MTLRNLGKSGLRVSLVGLGCNNFGGRMDLESSTKVIHKAIDAGITLFDTADAYGNQGGSETVLGQVLGERRKDIVLATKFGLPMDDGEKQGASRRYIMSAIEASLRRLKTDWIDLYQVHRHDPLTPIEETLEALTDLVRAGKVRYFGCSNFSAAQMTEAQWAAKHHGLHGFVSAQDEYSLLKRDLDAENLPMMERYGLGLLPYFPLASGLLTGKHKRGALAAGSRLATPAFTGRFTTDANFDIVEKLDAFVQARGHTLLELAFSWLAARPTVGSVIAGATKPEQIDANVKATGWALSAEDMAEVDKITKEQRGSAT
jgi:aryl-alcohol dehydrogenase-like predicted oxidoreductase